MKNKTLRKVIISILLILSIVMISSNSFADADQAEDLGGSVTSGKIKPSDINGNDYTGEFDLDFVDKITNLVRTMGIFVAVGAMMIIGIKYMTGSIEDKANYKKSMVPYLVGCFVLFGASVLAPQIKDLLKDIGTDTETVGNSILGIIRTIGTVITVAVLMILGIKYMMGSTDEKAEYKKSMIPYFVGVILLFAAVNLTSLIYDMSTKGIGDSNNGAGGNNQYDFSERQCGSCGQKVEPKFDIDKHTYVCPRCGIPMQ